MSQKQQHGNRSVLKLNACWQPIGYVSAQVAIKRIFDSEDSCLPVDVLLDEDGNLSSRTRPMTWDEWAALPVKDEIPSIGLSGGRRVRVPSVIIAKSYLKVPKSTTAFGLSGIYQRDGGVCSYCATTVARHEATMDHVIAKSSGGATSWDNLVLSCRKCNSQKADKTLIESGMVLRREPFTPKCLPVCAAMKPITPEFALFAA